MTAVSSIGSYDYYWHLAAGRWITEHHALPRTDPFAIASDRIPWIDGEWLFQLPLYLVHAMGGDTLVSVVRSLFIAALLLFLFLAVKRHAGSATAAAIVALAWIGADHRLGFRPETVATACAVIAIALLLQKPFSWRHFALYLGLTVFWINVHPSALLAPALAAAAFAGSLFVAEEQKTADSISQFSILNFQFRLGPLLLIPAAAAALLLNPFGISGVSGPLKLASLVQSGAFVNTEWLPSNPVIFPLLYLSAIGSLLILIRVDDRRQVLDRIFILLLLAFLAFRFVRNQGMFFMAMPLLISPALPPLTARRSRWLAWALAGSCLLLMLREHAMATGPDRRLFPVSSVAQLRATGLTGNIYNPDQFGGYLIWNFYPERRVLTDGRNELYRSFLSDYARARVDGRAWDALLRKYHIALAVDEFHSEHLDIVDAVTGQHRQLPASLIYFPRASWALIAFDDVSMVFAKRSEFPRAKLASLEYTMLVPDGADPVLSRSPEGLRQARIDLQRARNTLGESRIVRYLEGKIERR